jgi:hypothetical protein
MNAFLSQKVLRAIREIGWEEDVVVGEVETQSLHKIAFQKLCSQDSGD